MLEYVYYIRAFPNMKKWELKKYIYLAIVSDYLSNIEQCFDEIVPFLEEAETLKNNIELFLKIDLRKR